MTQVRFLLPSPAASDSVSSITSSSSSAIKQKAIFILFIAATGHQNPTMDCQSAKDARTGVLLFPVASLC